MTTDVQPMTGYTDTGEIPHWVAGLHPNLACCGQPLAYIPLTQRRQDPAVVCRKCRRSDAVPLPHDHDPTKDDQ